MSGPPVAGQTVADFVEALAAADFTAGAGAAGAVALALAAGCAAKALAVSARHGDEEALTQAADRARAIGRLALEGAERDAQDFKNLLHAKGDPEPQRALRADAGALLALAAELRALLANHRLAVAPTLTGDLVAAEALITAFERIERENLAEL